MPDLDARRRALTDFTTNMLVESRRYRQDLLDGGPRRDDDRERDRAL